ncbi:MAG: hypothetical protein Q9227_006667 [Pyrenula ochraceoflavens]
MMNLAEALRTQSQLPPKKELAEAFYAFFQSRCGRPRGITPKQLAAATKAFHFLRSSDGSNSESTKELTQDHLVMALKALKTCRKHRDANPSIQAFARLVYDDLASGLGESNDMELVNPPKTNDVLLEYVAILAQTGKADEAQRLIQSHSIKLTDPAVNEALRAILVHLAKERKEKELFEYLATMHSASLNNSQVAEIVRETYFSLINLMKKANELTLAKKVHAFSKERGISLTPKTMTILMMLALKHNDVQYGDQLLTEMQEPSSPPTPRQLATEFLWLSKDQLPKNIPALLEKTLLADQIDDVRDERRLVAVKTLLEHYVNESNTAVSSHLLVYMQENGLEPAQHVPLIEIQHLINAEEWSQAYEAYEGLSSMVLSPQPEAFVLSRLLGALCSAKDVPIEHVMALLEDLVKRDVEVSSETLAAATKVLLLYGDLLALSDLLRSKIGDFTTTELDLVQQEFLQACKDPDCDEMRAWDVYELYRKLFPDASVDTRTDIMRSFFKRGNSDLACLAFGHMRQSEIPDRRPTADTYAECYMGIAAAEDRDGLTLVHNMLKLDLEVAPTLKIKNSLIAAYAGCKLSYRSFEIYEDVLNSTEGPNWNTFAHALRACERFPGPGGPEAKKILGILKARDIEINRDTYISYIGALAGNLEVGYVTENEIFEALRSMESVVGETPDAFTIASLYNALPWQYDKTATEEWAAYEYPNVWEELKGLPRHQDEYGDKLFSIDRTIPP